MRAFTIVNIIKQKLTISVFSFVIVVFTKASLILIIIVNPLALVYQPQWKEQKEVFK